LASWLWRRRFLKISNVFLLFRYYLPLERGYLIPLSNLKSPTPKDDFCKVWLKLAKCFWKRRFLNDSIPFLHFCDYLPFEEELALYLINLNFPHPRIICTKFD
jgi:hypothetical protein